MIDNPMLGGSLGLIESRHLGDLQVIFHQRIIIFNVRQRRHMYTLQFDPPDIYIYICEYIYMKTFDLFIEYRDSAIAYVSFTLMCLDQYI